MENIFHCSLAIENNEKIIEHIKNNIYKIEINDKRGLGLLYKIKFDSKIIYILITDVGIIQDNNLDKIIIYLNEDSHEIKILNPRKKVIIKESNILIIEIKPNIDKIKDKYFIEIDNNNINEIDPKILFVNYTKDDDISISYGLYKNIEKNKITDKENNIIFSFIFSIDNFNLIGVYKDSKIFKINNKTIKEYCKK